MIIWLFSDCFVKTVESQRPFLVTQVFYTGFAVYVSGSNHRNVNVFAPEPRTYINLTKPPNPHNWHSNKGGSQKLGTKYLRRMPWKKKFDLGFWHAVNMQNFSFTAH
jgi:hypothetical protein